MLPTVIFDLDDTLVQTNGIYLEAMRRFARVVKDELKDYDVLVDLKKADIISIFSTVDLARRKHLHYRKNSFEESFVIAYALIASYTGVPFNPVFESVIRSIGESVFSSVPQLYDDSIPALNAISKIARCVVLTTGDYEVQKSKIESRHLSKYFKYVFITRKKTPDTYQQIINRLNVEDLSKCFAVGNSCSLDLLPAKKLGLACIHMKRAGDIYNEVELAEEEQKQLSNVDSIGSLEDVAGYILKGKGIQCEIPESFSDSSFIEI